eukprot:TRINITY_DN61732_c0_g1_i1.p1 TRINITY_DN61732_c0_g1~~TRINITY_DN61732_c0_g1_i1.p1  ORF type:complete len:233 (+),score=18.60 TRINITY_DN61732_c0_g1_i1:56-754(+)
MTAPDCACTRARSSVARRGSQGENISAQAQVVQPLNSTPSTPPVPLSAPSTPSVPNSYEDPANGEGELPRPHSPNTGSNKVFITPMNLHQHQSAVSGHATDSQISSENSTVLSDSCLQSAQRKVSEVQSSAVSFNSSEETQLAPTNDVAPPPQTQDLEFRVVLTPPTATSDNTTSTADPTRTTIDTTVASSEGTIPINFPPKHAPAQAESAAEVNAESQDVVAGFPAPPVYL